MLLYSVAGLVIASEISLPGRDPLDRAAEAAATIRLDHGPLRISSPIKTGPTWAVGEAELPLSISGVASFLLVAGTEIRVQPAAGRDGKDAGPFLTQNVLGLLMQQRGHTVLRTSVVAVNGEALLFCGDTATGKSTLAAAMAARGHAVLADDFCTVEWESDGAAIVHGDGVRLTLCPDSIAALELESTGNTAVREGSPKSYVPLRHADAGLPLKAMYFLGEDRRIETSRVAILRGIKRHKPFGRASTVRKRSRR